MAAAWVAPSPAEKYGGSFTRPQVATTDDVAASKAAGPAPSPAGGTFSPREPLFWFGVVLATSLGLAAYSTTVRVGRTEVSASIGQS